MLQAVVDFIVWIVWDWWYIGIFCMMVLESSFFPFPSEVAMVPAGYLISTWEMDFWLVFISWTFGALVGSSINYLLGFFLWEKAIKALINKYGKYLFVRLEHYEKAEKYFQIHGVITTFIWRFITVIRQYISLPAGVFKMNFLKFIIYTGIWAWIWNLILMAIWYIAWENKELITEYFGKVSIWLIIFIVIVLAVYIFVHKKIYAKKIK